MPQTLFLRLTIVATLLSVLPATAQDPPGPEREVAAVEFLTNGIPEHLEHLRELKRQRPEEYWREIEHGLGEQAHVEQTRVEEPERYRQFMAERELDRRCFELSRQVRESQGAARAGPVRELEQAVGELFDLRASWRRREIEMLERELARLRDEGEQRRRHRDVIVQRRIEELTGLAELYAW